MAPSTEVRPPPAVEKKPATDPKKEKEAKKAEDDLSEEDKQLRDELTMLVERLSENDTSLYMPSLETMRTLIRASTTSMTSVPKPLKFMRVHFDAMKKIHEKITDDATKKFCADIISVLSMTMSEKRECLGYKLNGSNEPIDQWGHEYVRHLAGEIAAEWGEIPENDSKKEKLLSLTNEVVPYHLQHNAEAEACDLAMEIERLDVIEKYIDNATYPRVCLYLTSCVPYVPDPENVQLLRTALRVFGKFQQYPQALRVAMQLNDMDEIKRIFEGCKDVPVRKQLAFMLCRQHIFMPTEDEDINDILSNANLNVHFLSLGRELDIMEPKIPEDIYKSHLENTRSTFAQQVDSARQNLAASFVNGFVNAGFGQDKLIMKDGTSWLYKNKEHGMLSATASLGLLLLWDVNGGLSQIDKYLYSAEDYIKSGALLACGIVSAGVRDECDPPLALLTDYVVHTNNVMRIGPILGLGLAYAGSNRPEVLELLLPVLAEANAPMELIGLAALSCGLISVGARNIEVTATVLQTLMEKTPDELKDPFAKFLPLALGLSYLGKQELADVTLTALDVLADPFRSMAKTLVEVCAYAGSGNVLKVQNLLHICSEHYDGTSAETTKKKEKKDDKDKKDDKEKGKEEKKDEPSVDLSQQQAIAVLGIALIAMGEEIGAEMCMRTFGHLLRYCEPAIRRAVPLAMGLLSVSNPQMSIVDTLSKFSHDHDPEVEYAAVLAMGLVGAGTNNARIAALLRQLAQYYYRDPNSLFMVRIAQGLVHLGKGTMTMNPYHSDKQLLSPVALAGLLATLVAALDCKHTILGKSHYLLYCLVTAIHPRMLVTFDEDLQPLPVSVRVGQAVDVVGQAGKPKTITGFQTHTTPVLLSFGERAELATEEFVPCTNVLEGFVILRKNPDYTD
ncbi:unnamed protein product [Notodromas monacha]|uniref:26S proteasome non-ATPase regulatory subunit 2 n=1 Tax=Notodromas monacha TaxID=399045 RepID=A0A7R9BQ41_9CRUS|nr:unnamed protein product [Notodromas monacha]CAG0919368.1 unnamed protein product [Notodromas monacha]